MSRVVVTMAVPYTAEQREDIIERICRGLVEGRSLRQVCEDDGMPNRQTVLNWLAEDADFSARCARARELQADVLLDRMGEIEEDTLDGRTDPAAARAVLGSMQWRAAKLAPKKYSERHVLAGDEENPVAVTLAERLTAARGRVDSDD